MKDLIVILILVLIITSAALYIIKRKKAGEKCIGCPYAKECKNHSCGK